MSLGAGDSCCVGREFRVDFPNDHHPVHHVDGREGRRMGDGFEEGADIFRNDFIGGA